jgi:NADH-quinone oxidoreductase subunit K
MISSLTPLSWLLILASGMFAIGLYGALTRKHAVGVLIAIEIMLNAANINFIAFWRYLHPPGLTGQIFVLFSIAVAGAEVALGLAIIIAVYRQLHTVQMDEISELKG